MAAIVEEACTECSEYRIAMLDCGTWDKIPKGIGIHVVPLDNGQFEKRHWSTMGKIAADKFETTKGTDAVLRDKHVDEITQF